MLYLETSARAGVNVDAAFVQLAQHIFDSYKLDRKVGDIAAEEIKAMEQHGILVNLFDTSRYKVWTTETSVEYSAAECWWRSRRFGVLLIIVMRIS